MDPTTKQPITTHAAIGEMERTREMRGIPWAGTNLPEELLEVQRHLKEMIGAGYTYKFMEEYLTQHGYAYNVVRKAFKVLTGLSAEEAMNFKWQYSPGNIPGLNMGWGYAKDGKSSYFIMKIANWYMIFHQVDDMNRVEDSRHLTPQEAKEACVKKVKEFQQWNPPVKETKTKMDMTQLYRAPALFMQSARFRQIRGELDTIHSRIERKAVIDQAYVATMLSEPQRDALLHMYAEDDIKEEVMADQLKELTDAAEEKPINLPRTPQEFFDTNLAEMGPSANQAEIEGLITSYIQQRNAEFANIDVQVDRTMFKHIKPGGTPSPEGDEPDVTNANAWVAVILKITDSDNDITKPGMIVFEVIGSDLKTRDTIQGEDRRRYGFTAEGLASYLHGRDES